MAERKRRVPKVQASFVPQKTTGKVIQNEVIYSEPSKSSSFIGAVLAGEIVDIVDNSLYNEGWTKIDTAITHRIGFINSKSIL